MFREPIVTIDEKKVNNEMDFAQRREFVDKCPRKVFSYNEQK